MHACNAVLRDSKSAMVAATWLPDSCTSSELTYCAASCKSSACCVRACVRARVCVCVCMSTQQLFEAAAVVPIMKRCGSYVTSDSLNWVTGEQCTNWARLPRQVVEAKKM